MFNTDGINMLFRTLCYILVDMFSFEPGEINRYPILSKRIRLEVLRRVQIYSLRNCDKAIYLSKYAMKVINSLQKIINMKLFLMDTK